MMELHCLEDCVKSVFKCSTCNKECLFNEKNQQEKIEMTEREETLERNLQISDSITKENSMLKSTLYFRDEEINQLKLQVNLLSQQLKKESVDQILDKL